MNVTQDDDDFYVRAAFTSSWGRGQGKEALIMWWECSECGGVVEDDRPPLHCGECGTAGVIFVSTEDAAAGDPESDGLRAAWLRIGFERPRRAAAASP